MAPMPWMSMVTDSEEGGGSGMMMWTAARPAAVPSAAEADRWQGGWPGALD